MGNPFSIPCDPCVNKFFHCLDEKVSYTHNLKKKLTALESTLEELTAKRDDLLRKITREEDRGMQRLAEVKVWLTKVETIEKRIIDLLSVGDNQLQKLCLCGFCCKSLKSSYCYGKNVFLTLKEAEKLKSRVFEEIVDKPQTSKVQEIPLQPTIVGQETMLNKAWNSFKDDGVGIMGLYGMGGVGKTTLLTQMNNKLTEERCGFDYVIWVVVSKELRVEMIQDKIALTLGLAGEEWKQKSRSQKSVDILNFLRPKRFVLFLDDIWDKVDLAEIGVPFPTPQNKCKVAFTSRSQDVCAQMGVKSPMKVECLNDNEAFELFKKKVGNTTLESDPDIPNLARIVANKCCGLPLALNVIGETMSCKTTVQEWHEAIEDLASNATEIYGMEDKILRLLKYSYDNLRGEKVKSCLLYCALFPEDHRIGKERLINYWIGQGIVDGSEDIEKAENKGYGIIGNLVRASLLMDEVNEKEEPAVVMHDVVREMALWIASDLGKEKEAFIVHAGVGLDKLPMVKNWKDVRRMSLMNSNIKHLIGSPECLELTTLLLQNADLETISNEFFKSMPKLVVLDLSDNIALSELPDGISELGSLKYLNLSRTGIRHLSKGIQELKKLIHLVFGNQSFPSSIAGISNLHSLKILDYSSRGSSWDCDIVEELETLEHLQILTIVILSPAIPVMEQFFSSPRLTSCTRYLMIQYMNLESSGMAIPVTMNKLRHFHIYKGTISEIKMGNICIKSKTVSPLHNLRDQCFSSLSEVIITHCGGLRELTLLMFAPNLKKLYVRSVHQLEDIINEKKACEGEESRIVPFPKLIVLGLMNLPKLKSIYWSPLRFPCLKIFLVSKCPKLKKLPVDSQSGENGLVLKYRDESWFEDLEWEDEATKSRFSSSRELGLH